MTDYTPLLERLETQKFCEDRAPGFVTHWYEALNPDGPEAARVIREQAAEIERLTAALEPFRRRPKT